ncbi:GIY-YIG nuclease family protein [Kiloniella sp.]|uniref:GIY-YIG nuclease family protein n=1 Tax=Kiloniella sp. TaxID=1938587 RepID=UPI003A91F11F
MKGRSIRLFLVDGTPTGIITAEIMNWTGHVIAAPRSRLADLVKREEPKRTGIYFLTGSDPENPSRLKVYIGESDNVGKRLAQHNRSEDQGGKDFWEKACLITSKDQNLTKAHARYLESRLISITQEAGRVSVINNNAPEYGYLPEADIADMEFFIEQIRITLPVLGYEFLREKPRISEAIERSTSTAETNDTKPAGIKAQTSMFEIYSKKLDLNALATEVDGDFIVLKGSKAQSEWKGKSEHNIGYSRLHELLHQTGTLKINGPLSQFEEDYAFSSPSAASAIIFGRADNGRTSWKVKGSNQTYADWQEAQVDEQGD